MSEIKSWIVSCDDHLIEPLDLWVARVPEKDRDRVPHATMGDKGYDLWWYDDVLNGVPITGGGAQAGKPMSEYNPGPVAYRDMRPGFYDPVARLDDMNLDGVLAALCFPSVPRFCGQI